MYCILRTAMGFVFALCLVWLPAAPRAIASEALLKTAHIAAPVFDAYRTRAYAVDASALGPALPQALSAGISSEAVAPDDLAHISRDLLVSAHLDAAPSYLSEHGVSTGAIIGEQHPAGTSAWRKSIISFPDSGQPGRYLCSMRAPGAVLEHIALYHPSGLYKITSISETPVSRSAGPEVYRIRESELLRQLRRPDARQWLDRMLSGERGLRLLIIRSDSAAADPGDTLVIMVEEPAAGSHARHALICGWAAMTSASAPGDRPGLGLRKLWKR